MLRRSKFDADCEDSILSRGLRQHRQVLLYETAHIKKGGFALKIEHLINGW